MNNSCTVIDTPEGIKLARLCALKGMLYLETKGMKRSRGLPSAYSILKREYGLKGSKQAVFEQVKTMVDKVLNKS